jgi:hypothetical protein
MDETSAVAVSFTFRGGQVPVTFGPHLTKDLAARALESSHFRSWVRRCEEVNETPGTWDAPGTVTKRIEMRGVEIQSVDMFGSMYVDFEGTLHVSSHTSRIKSYHPNLPSCTTYLQGWIR